jgi:hypothetical protein
MSRRAALEAALGDKVRSVQVTESRLHGEPGERIRVTSHEGTGIDVFLADSRKITEDHAVTIVTSHLHRIGVHT